jgi:hypothetical protein
MVIEDIKDSDKLLQRVVIFLFVCGSLLGNLLVDLSKERMQLQVRVLKPFEDSDLFLLSLSFQFVSSQVHQDRVRLVE